MSNASFTFHPGALGSQPEGLKFLILDFAIISDIGKIAELLHNVSFRHSPRFQKC